MLSIGKLAPGQQQYYLDSVARGAEEYYTGVKEAPGQWIGAGSTRLGLAGSVEPDDLHRLLSFEDPVTGRRLPDARSDPSNAGFDATFSVPKSVSLLFALGSPEVSNEVRNADSAALAGALGVLEQEAAVARRGKGGATLVEADGFAAAAFRHRTSRNGDPQVHTHVVIANVVHSSVDGRWTALDARHLYRWSRPVGCLYEAQLRWELTERLGVGWRPVRRGMADIAGVPDDVLRAFSTRRQEIESYLAEHDEAGPRAAQRAALLTRRRKDSNADPTSMVPAWRAKARALGFDADTIERLTGRVQPQPTPRPGSLEGEALYRDLAAPDGLTSHRSTFSRPDVIEAICERLPAGGRVEDVLALTDGFLTSEHVLAVGVDGDRRFHRGDGRAMPAGAALARWTTPEMIACEQRVLDLATGDRRISAGYVFEETATRAVDARPTLTAEQAAMVRHVCGSGRAVDVVEGVAGAGKTFALAVAHDAWTAAGYRVHGACLAARAAKNLQDGAGIASTTLDRLLARIERGDGLNSRDVVVVDEGSMVGTRKLLRLLTAAHDAGAKVVLVGDPRQLPEVEAGGAFAHLARQLDAPALIDNRRQCEGWERQALATLRGGETDEALAMYDARDRVHAGGSDDEVRDQLVADWLAARERGEEVLMIASRLRDVDDLNRRARTLLHRSGQLGAAVAVIGGRPFAIGEQVLALRNDHASGVLNGTRGTLQSVGRDALTIAADGRQLTVPRRYAEAGHLAHGYATTIHKAQGTTVDRCLVLADDTLAQEHTYTAMSRGRLGNDLYVTATDRRVDDRHAPEVTPDPLQSLRAAIRRSSAERLAIDQPTEPPPRSIEALRSERDRVRERLAAKPADPTAKVHALDTRIEQARQALAAATSERDQLAAVAGGGRLARRLHRRAVSEADAQLPDAETLVRYAADGLAGLTARRAALDPLVRAWQEDAVERAAEHSRLRHLELALRLAQPRAPGLERGRGGGLGIGL